MIAAHIRSEIELTVAGRIFICLALVNPDRF